MITTAVATDVPDAPPRDQTIDVECVKRGLILLGLGFSALVGVIKGMDDGPRPWGAGIIAWLAVTGVVLAAGAIRRMRSLHLRVDPDRVAWVRTSTGAIVEAMRFADVTEVARQPAPPAPTVHAPVITHASGPMQAITLCAVDGRRIAIPLTAFRHPSEFPVVVGVIKARLDARGQVATERIDPRFAGPRGAWP